MNKKQNTLLLLRARQNKNPLRKICRHVVANAVDEKISEKIRLPPYL